MRFSLYVLILTIAAAAAAEQTPAQKYAEQQKAKRAADAAANQKAGEAALAFEQRKQSAVWIVGTVLTKVPGKDQVAILVCPPPSSSGSITKRKDSDLASALPTFERSNYPRVYGIQGSYKLALYRHPQFEALQVGQLVSLEVVSVGSYPIDKHDAPAYEPLGAP